MVELFSYFISQSENQAQLFIAFHNYLPNLYLPEDRPMVSFKLKNPFEFQVRPPAGAKHDTNANGSNEFLTGTTGLRGLSSEDIDSGIERLEELLEINPFEPRYYRLISLLNLKKKKFYEAELHALALIFLEKTRENYLHLVKVYKASRKKEKAKEIKKELIKRYKY